VLVLGWDIHSQTRLGARERPEDGVELAALLREVTERTPSLRIHVLTWDFAPIYLTERELLPLVQLGWRAGPSVEMRLDAAHPIGASHHQKVVVIDDEVAFTGGVDLTIHRWDDAPHAADDPLRTLPDGTAYPPFHDAMMMVEGAAAAALGDLARERWRIATGQELEAVRGDGFDIWPSGVESDLTNALVGIARTMPAYGERQPAREIEAVYLEAIGAARRFIYVENQYLTSEVICDALSRRLEEEKGPEVCVVLPREESGALEKVVMGALRARIVARLRAADRQGHLRVVTPLAGDHDVYVHAKVLVVDDRYAQIGSANLCNRSMGLDSECDLGVEARNDDERRAVARLRNRLLGEHLGTPPEEIREAIARTGSLLAVVDRLGDEVHRFESLALDGEANEVVDPALLDPGEPLIEKHVRRSLPRPSVEKAQRSASSRAVSVAVALAVVAGVLLWAHLGDPDAASIVERLDAVRDRPGGVPVMLGVFVVASLMLVPVNVLIVASVTLLGPWLGAGVSLAGSVASASLGWLLGKVLWRDTVRRLAGDRLNEVSRRLSKHGLVAMIAVRIVPIAPFTVVSLVAGSSRVSLRNFALGTFVGVLPGVALLSFASDRVVAAMRSPDAGAILVAALGVGLLLAAFAFMTRVLRGS
jgi:phosphatidylserine/phosphatidylglycerophosphate/cardiolipin synthase-like enzyme/uncharacterized membrane protein YdjX (TVP38/TMEM64 family)